MWRLTLFQTACSLLHMEHPQSTSPAQLVARRVNDEIRESGITVVRLCEKTGIPRTTMTRRLSEHSPFNLNELHAIATALRIPVSRLLAPLNEAVAS